MSEGLKGSCLCGAVTYIASAGPAVVGHCYCVDCRKSSGTGHCTHVGLPGPLVTVSGKVKIYDHPADSGNVVSRAFCPECGSPVYSTNSGFGDMIFLRASSLDGDAPIEPSISVYASRAPSWDPVDPALPSFPKMPPGPIPGTQ